ncbi:3-phosphoshikimate 1-carboxyvinyltransferase [bacterium]|nr:3-phosphoshikimate 1-carboxyvinyltransferase [bacterium]
MDKTITPVRSLRGSISVPGDKSVSHRSLMFGALAEGETVIRNLMPGKDVGNTRSILQQLGVRITDDGDAVRVRGAGLFGFSPPEKSLDAGNSGTTMRLMSGILAAQPFVSILTGDESLSKRPMNRIIIPLGQMGAIIDAQPGGTCPLTIHGRTLSPIHYHSPVASAQIKSCVLLAGLHTEGITAVTEPALSRDHTERMLKAFGVPVKRENTTVSVQGPAKLTGTEIMVPGDISAAAFFLVAASLIPSSELRIRQVGLNPTRSGILTVLRRMGCEITEENPQSVGDEPMADLVVRSGRLSGTVIEGDLIPQLVDEIPVLAVAALFAEGETIVKDAKELRVKETDRIRALETNIGLMGGRIETFEDGFRIMGPQKLTGAGLDSYWDHRIAMAFAVAGLMARGQTVIRRAECAEISHPGFYEDLEALSHV